MGRAAAFLWQKQAEDGGWHSATYGLWRSGQSLTPFVLHALLAVPEDACPRPNGGVENALAFIRKNVNERGSLGQADPDILDYPNYATAYALLCLKRSGTEDDGPLIARMRDYLLSEQFHEPNGFDPSSPAYGGWGFGGQQPPGQTGHMDLAHTRRVLEALRAADAPAQAFQRAERFLRMVQKHPADDRPQPLPPEHEEHAAAPPPFDGGFYFSPVVLRANKGRLAFRGERPYWQSYATATCDGLLSLLACGVPPEDGRVAAARKWLEAHPRLEHPQGIPDDYEGENWRQAVHFYHLAVRAEVYAAIKQPGKWRQDIAALVTRDQKSDGSFASGNPLMKENDPLLATALAVTVLAACRE